MSSRVSLFPSIVKLTNWGDLFFASVMSDVRRYVQLHPFKKGGSAHLKPFFDQDPRRRGPRYFVVGV